jgi:hypothetical protein
VGAVAVSGGARWLVVAAIGVVVAELIPILTASRRPPIPTPRRGIRAPPATISAAVAGRDEAIVLPQLVADVAAQDHRDAGGRPLFELVVVDDRSSDGTADAVRAAAHKHGIEDVTTVIRREGAGLPDGKGAALTAAQPDRCRGDVVLVLDADARIAPGFLRRLAAYVAAGADAVTARRRILHADSSWLAGAQADEQTQDGELQRGRWASGGCSEFRGNGIALRRSLLASVGGWRARALTEDIDLSAGSRRPGTTVAWAIDLEVWEEPVRTWSGLWRQRSLERGRVCGGSSSTGRRHAEPALSVRGAVRLRGLRGPAVAPPLILGAAAAIWHGRLGIGVAPGTYLRLAASLPRRPALGGTAARRRAVRRPSAWGVRREPRSFSAVWLVSRSRGDVAARRPPRHVRHDKMAHAGSESRRARSRMSDREPRAAARGDLTGGTISMRVDPSPGATSGLSGAEILARTPGLVTIAELVPIDLGRTPASHFTFEGLFEIAAAIRAAQADPAIDGVVLVQGTDVIEETAFFWDLVLDGPTPVIVTGAMRSA